MLQTILFAVFGMGFFGSLSFAEAQSASNLLKAPHVEIQLLSSKSAMAPGEESWWGMAFRMEPHWHVYWKNPGDSGAAPKIQFQTEGGTVGELKWPAPERIPFGDFTNLGYENLVVFPFSVKADQGASFVQVQAKLEWLVCREECIPGFGNLSLKIPVAEKSAASEFEKSILDFHGKVPLEIEASDFTGGENLRFETLNAELAEISWTLKGGEMPSEQWTVYPIDGERFSPALPVTTKEAAKVRHQLKILSDTPTPKETRFVLVSTEGRVLEIDFQKKSDLSNPVDGFWILLLSAILGGMILNLMPCVFPVLSIKVFSFLKAHENNRTALVKDGLLYTLGTVVTFALLGVAFLLIRQSGEAVGWGFQLQSAVVVFALAVLFFVLALNFLGFFEMGTFAMNWAGLRMTRKGWTSAFGTGVLSVLVAAPCTGPFMGAALGASTFLPATLAMMIFLAMGFGLALPLLLLCLFPAWLSGLPKPGAWMNSLKEFFAFPLFATVLWLLWVLVQQAGADGLLWAGTSLLMVTMAFWIARRDRRWLAVVFFLVGVALPAWKLHGLEVALRATDSVASKWQPYEANEIQKARANGQAVFIDFTAAWCITCQWNKKAVLETSAIQALFERNNVLIVRADWTKQDSKVTEALEKFGRASVPLYVYYPPNGGEAKILPQILAPSMIEDLF
ncbi:MAG: thioredoxin family protein [Bdellovibrionaceae bacterium]|nr:thioredoxin family protein [Pseudobdellovibrionaceae bacterium]